MSTQINQSWRRLRQTQRMVAMAQCSRIRVYVSFEVVPFVLRVSTLLTSKCPSFFSIAIISDWCSPQLVIKSLCSTLQFSRPVIMSGDECTERSADHDDAHTSFSKLVEKILMQNGRRGFKLSGTLKRALFQENRVLDPKSKSGGYFNSVRGSNRSRYCS